MDVEEYIHDEVVRQKSNNFDEFRKAYEYAYSYTPENLPQGDLGRFVQEIAWYVEPDINYWCNRPTIGYTTLRVTEVGFANGGSAAKAVDVPHQFDRLMNFWSPDFSPEDVEVWIKSLLETHPWQDGNGRTGSLLRNWLLGQMSDPEPLPYYRF